MLVVKARDISKMILTIDTILQYNTIQYYLQYNTIFVPSVTEWIKAQDFDASAGFASPVRAPVRAATLCP